MHNLVLAGVQAFQESATIAEFVGFEGLEQPDVAIGEVRAEQVSAGCEAEILIGQTRLEDGIGRACSADGVGEVHLVGAVVDVIKQLLVQ